VFEAARPILLNGIEEVVSRPDLGDRAIFLTLAPIGEAQRRSESELWREFEIARPRILGALLDAAVHGLRTQGRVRLDRLPRMADFAIWATASETALWPAGTFARAYAANRRTAIEGMIDADPVAACVRDILAVRGSWAGSAGDLLRADAHRSSHDLLSERTGWPKNPARHWASTLPSAGKAGPEAGSLGYVQLRKISSVPSAASATSLHRDRPVTFATTTLAQI